MKNSQNGSDLNNNDKLYAMKKLWKEYNDINQKGDVPFTVGLKEEDNVFEWLVAIEGPENTIYEGALF